jgi:SAM-dependent methyltransferase
VAGLSDKQHWNRFWAESSRRGEIYSTDFRIVEHLAEHVRFEGLKILEVGAGTGRDSMALAGRGAFACALDYSERSLDLMCESAGEGIVVVCGDALQLPFADESFDVVFHQGLLEHFSDPEILIAENRRVLKKGGFLLVDVPQKYHYYTLLKHMLMLMGKWFAGWETEFTVRGLSRLVSQAGLEIVDVYGENLSPPVWYRGLRKVLLRFKMELPMYPGFFKIVSKMDKAVKKLAPGLHRNTAMVIGVIATRK